MRCFRISHIAFVDGVRILSPAVSRRRPASSAGMFPSRWTFSGSHESRRHGTDSCGGQWSTSLQAKIKSTSAWRGCPLQRRRVGCRVRLCLASSFKHTNTHTYTHTRARAERDSAPCMVVHEQHSFSFLHATVSCFINRLKAITCPMCFGPHFANCCRIVRLLGVHSKLQTCSYVSVDTFGSLRRWVAQNMRFGAHIHNGNSKVVCCKQTAADTVLFLEN